MPELRIPDIPSGDHLGAGLTLTVHGDSISTAEACEDGNFAFDRNAQTALSVADSAHVLATGLITSMRLGIEPLANLRVRQSYPAL